MVNVFGSSRMERTGNIMLYVALVMSGSLAVLVMLSDTSFSFVVVLACAFCFVYVSACDIFVDVLFEFCVWCLVIVAVVIVELYLNQLSYSL